MTRTSIFTAYTNPAQADPSEQVELIREGFSFYAFLFALLWLLYHRLWIPAVGYALALGALMTLGNLAGLPEASLAVLQLGLQLALGFSGYDLKRWVLTRRGYRFSSVIVAHSVLDAERRYYDVAA